MALSELMDYVMTGNSNQFLLRFQTSYVLMQF